MREIPSSHGRATTLSVLACTLLSGSAHASSRGSISVSSAVRSGEPGGVGRWPQCSQYLLRPREEALQRLSMRLRGKRVGAVRRQTGEQTGGQIHAKVFTSAEQSITCLRRGRARAKLQACTARRRKGVRACSAPLVAAFRIACLLAENSLSAHAMLPAELRIFGGNVCQAVERSAVVS